MNGMKKCVTTKTQRARKYKAKTRERERKECSNGGKEGQKKLYSVQKANRKWQRGFPITATLNVVDYIS